jgi:glycosyltransferase involved in cell wall biosynthesis
MGSPERFPEEKGTMERLTERFATLWAENRRLTGLVKQWAEVESSTAWALAQRLSRWRRRLAPEGSWRQVCLRFLFHSLRPWRYARTAPQSPCVNQEKLPSSQALRENRAAAPAAPRDKIRIAYIGSRLSVDTMTIMRYRAHNLIEALPLAGLEGTFVPQEEIYLHLPRILAHDLIVLVRRMRNDAVTTLIGLARRQGLPIVYDIDDYIFDPWILPYVEAFHHEQDKTKALRLMDELGACLDQCDYFTGSTPYLAEKAAALGKDSFVIRNGLNSVQVSLSQSAREQRRLRRNDSGARIGYFSGTRTHQADFRVVYPALMRLLHEQRSTRLVIVGHLDIDAFPGLAPVADQIDLLPICHWHELPALIASVDINIIPLEPTPFNEGKSNLKYYEAGLVETPSIASPTRILCDSITPGRNGLLARNTEEWYHGLKELIAQPDWRRQMGRNALEHVLQNYTPVVIATEAAAVYRQILQLHRSRHLVSKQILNIVLLAADAQGEQDEFLSWANEWAAAGHGVTVLLSCSEISDSALGLKKFLAQRFIEPLFTVQHGGEVPHCDVLIATDKSSRELARIYSHRARLTIADDELLSLMQKIGRGREALLWDWLQKMPRAA